MGRSKTIEMLKTLANSPDGRSESARLAEIIDAVENALKAGVKRKAVLDALHDHYGFKMTMSGFEKALRKLRSNKTPIPIIANTGNQLVQRTHNETKNTDLVVIHSASQSMEMALATKEEDEDENDGEPKSTELEFRRKIKKSVDYAEIEEMGRKFKEEQREKKRIEKEQELEKRKNQSSY